MLWGNKDSKTSTGTANISSNGYVNGVSTAFTTEARVGDFITVASSDYMIISIYSDTAAQVVGPQQNPTVAAAAAASYNLSEKPKYVLLDDGYHGVGGITTTVYGMDTTENAVANGAVRELVLTYAGTGYNANAAVAWTGGAGNTVAVADAANNTSNGAIVSVGRVIGIRTANVGAGFTIGPVGTISPPAPITFNANTGVSTTDATIAISTANSKFLVGDALTYTVSTGNTVISPLTSGATYYVSFSNTSTIAIAAAAGGANLAIVKGLTESGHTIQGKTATVVPILSGVHESDHAGWVRRIVGTGGRAGRVTHETLVAMGTISGDAEDTVLPDA
jgi:hypothetical protein